MLQRVVLNYFRLFIVIVSFVWNQTATAHHSRSNLDLERAVSLYGVVKDFTFRNPHAWIELAVDLDGKSVAYTIEGRSVGSLRRLGWDQKSLSIGDRVMIIANPDNDPDRRCAYLVDVTMTSGDRLAGTAGATRSHSVEETASPVEPSTDFSGVWTRVVDEKYFNLDAFSKPTHWPLNKSGREMIANYDKNDDPAFECIALAMPRIAYAPFRHRWERVGDQLIISKELSPFIREIDLEVKNWPDQMGASRLGTSIGWIETDGSLEIMTQGFPPEKWGLY